MTLSVITPTLNPGPKLEKAIISVLSQEHSSVEHIVIDGGSSDGALDLVKRYDHVNLVSESDDGIYDAMNKSIALASGDWLYFLGADDYLADSYVLRDLATYFKSDYDVVYGDVVSSRFEGRHDGPFDANKIRKQNICHQAIFFRRKLFQKVGQFNSLYPCHADWDHNMRWILNSSIRKLWVDRVIAVYADGGFSSVTPDPQFRRDRLFRYLTYAKGEISPFLYLALWGKDLALGLKSRDWKRMRRALSGFRWS